ncbi:MAG: Dam family site-specific DNA-(adenine-N6)-methyltransferase [Myxococcales bacterium]|nr:Dam family site-specific DNA-(adenine-N6)-methyltransferase [Myxococcales bacterium]MCB9526445.1 Dam family site-specific DNA-(adenine-N6)-methyltransferase [Myxococcales bacterium]
MAQTPGKYETPRPFLKWAGGKRSLLGEILPRLPDAIDTYVEPFLGGGAVFLALAREHLDPESPRRIGRAVLADRNPELVNVWTRIKEEPEAVIAAVQALGTPDADRYYAVRDQEPQEPVARAGRMLWLNRTCYNGLYRLNRSGQFNVPFGRYKRPRLVDVDNIRAVSRALNETRAEIVEADFRTLQARSDLALGPGAVVYADPPYLPHSRTASFTAYDRLPFGMDAHEALAEWFVALQRLGVGGLLSNNKTTESVALYRRHGLRYVGVEARRSINRDPTKRGPVPEVLVYINVTGRLRKAAARRARRVSSGA